MKGFFITGTDTNVGKTLVASALVFKFAQDGFKAVGMKPVAAGYSMIDGKLQSEDVTQLVAASNVSAPSEQINPYAFEPAIAPHIAAAQSNLEIKLDVISKAYAALTTRADVIIIEGAGGFYVPLSESLDTAALAKALDLPVILVVGMRLGCLNHALLTAEAIRARGLQLTGWIANTIDPDMAMFEENISSLKQLIQAPCLGVIPWQPNAGFAAAANYLDGNLIAS
jgi:dethiobiotin synthetase